MDSLDFNVLPLEGNTKRGLMEKYYYYYPWATFNGVSQVYFLGDKVVANCIADCLEYAEEGFDSPEDMVDFYVHKRHKEVRILTTKDGDEEIIVLSKLGVYQMITGCSDPYLAELFEKWFLETFSNLLSFWTVDD